MPLTFFKVWGITMVISYLIFPIKKGLAFHANLICIKCQNLFSGKNKKKYFKRMYALNKVHLYVLGSLTERRNMSLTLSMLVKNCSRRHLEIFCYFSQKMVFDSSCKLSSSETFCLKCQNLFSGENFVIC